MAQRGELNVGQLVRERHGRDAVLVGFTTYTGTVTAASDWDAPAERKQRPAGAARAATRRSSTRPGMPAFLLCPLRRRRQRPRRCASRGSSARSASSTGPRPSAQSHYFPASARRQFDAVLHIDHTRAVEPLERDRRPGICGEPPETYPTAL